MANDHNPAFFRVHLESLTAFARELDAQIDALVRPMDHVAVLASRPLGFGRFAEAFELGRAHLTATGEMDALLRAGRDAIGFAGQVTRAVVDGYAATDQAVADSYRQTYGGAP